MTETQRAALVGTQRKAKFPAGLLLTTNQILGVIRQAMPHRLGHFESVSIHILVGHKP